MGLGFHPGHCFSGDNGGKSLNIYFQIYDVDYCVYHSLKCSFTFKIIFENRFKMDTGNDCLISVDGTDFRVPEVGSTYYSHKFKKVVYDMRLLFAC